MNFESIFKLENQIDFFSELQAVICGGVDNFDIEKISNEETNFLLVLQAQGIIDNGGFQYFFESDFPNKPDYKLFVIAYNSIGATDVANIFERVLSFFSFKNPNENINKRLELLKEKGELFGELDKSIVGNDEVYDLLEKYVRDNKSKIIESLNNRFK